MAWEIRLDAKAEKDLSKLDKPIAKRITRFLREKVSLADNPRQRGKSLTGNLSGLWRYRIGDYRVIAEIQDDKLVVLAVKIGHRSNVYEK